MELVHQSSPGLRMCLLRYILTVFSINVFNYHFIKCEKTAVLNCSAAVIYSLDSTFLESSSDIQSCQ